MLYKETAKLSGEKRVKEVKRIFLSIYEKYDLINKIITFGMDIYWRSKAIELIPKCENGYILDLGTGTGDIPVALVKRNRGSHIVGLDLSRGMLSVGMKKIRKGGHRVSLFEGNGFYLPFKGESFDAVVSAYTIRNISPVENVILEMKRVLKKDGTLVIVDISMPEQRVLKKMLNYYFFNIVPSIGGLMSHNKEAYNYLPESILNYPTRDQMVEKMRSAGLKWCRYIDYTFGTATVYVGYR